MRIDPARLVPERKPDAENRLTLVRIIFAYSWLVPLVSWKPLLRETSLEWNNRVTRLAI